MAQTGAIGLAITAVVLALLGTVLKPMFDELGLFRSVANHNNEKCTAIDGLEACEDIFVDRPSGLAYLACSDRVQRAKWTPAMDLLELGKLPFRSTDYLAILDLNTHKHRRIELLNLPPRLLQRGIYLHGLDVFVHSDSQLDASTGDQIKTSSASKNGTPRPATIYFINHSPPFDTDSNSTVVAQSVVEVFDTVLGSPSASYRKTIEHDLIVTPNNLVGMSENSFYLTNDHGIKRGWKRHVEPFFFDPKKASIVYCSFKDELECSAALRGTGPFPNGIAKGPGNSIYMVNSIKSHLRLLQIQANHTLVMTDELKLPCVVDNIYVTPSGSILITGIPKFLNFRRVLLEPTKTPSPSSPTEIWKVSNRTGDDVLHSVRLKLEKVFGDDGCKVSGSTAVAAWGSKLFITGISSPHVSACELDEKLIS